MSYQQELHEYIERQQEYIKELADTVETMACLTQGLLKVVHKVEGDDGIKTVLNAALAAASRISLPGQASPDKSLIQKFCEDAKSPR